MPVNDHIGELLSSIALRNDQAAYKELFIQLHRPLKQFAYSILKSNEEAEELVSDVFIKIWQKRVELTNIEAPLFYFYTVTKNLALSQLRKRKSVSGYNPEEWLVQMNSVYFDPEKLMMTEEMMRQIQKIINDLPPRCRIIFKLIKEDGLKYKETAELLHLSVKTIEAQMAIALRRIARCMHFEVRNSSTTKIPAKKS